jgi:nitrate ABC transporter ATP-binding subunit
VTRVPLEVSGLTKTFPTPAGSFTAVRNVNVRISEGEFVCLLGHSGCGKSTVLSIAAGLERATEGGVVLDGREVVEPGLDRAVVFQTPSLLPWLTARENVRLAVNRAFARESRHERAARVTRVFDLLDIGEVADERPGDLSLGTRQCVSLARALAMEPRCLLLDEPFSMLDSLTRFALQDELLRAWDARRRIVVMVTHDIDEALYLADRLVLMTDGPEARVGDVLSVPFGRPRSRAAVLAHPEYHACRRRVFEFLEHHAGHGRPAARMTASH